MLLPECGRGLLGTSLFPQISPFTLKTMPGQDFPGGRVPGGALSSFAVAREAQPSRKLVKNLDDPEVEAPRLSVVRE
jgi:hypothetical protein